METGSEEIGYPTLPHTYCAGGFPSSFGQKKLIGPVEVAKRVGRKDLAQVAKPDTILDGSTDSSLPTAMARLIGGIPARCESQRRWRSWWCAWRATGGQCSSGHMDILGAGRKPAVQPATSVPHRPTLTGRSAPGLGTALRRNAGFGHHSGSSGSGTLAKGAQASPRGDLLITTHQDIRSWTAWRRSVNPAVRNPSARGDDSILPK